MRFLRKTPRPPYDQLEYATFSFSPHDNKANCYFATLARHLSGDSPTYVAVTPVVAPHRSARAQKLLSFVPHLVSYDPSDRIIHDFNELGWRESSAEADTSQFKTTRSAAEFNTLLGGLPNKRLALGKLVFKAMRREPCGYANQGGIIRPLMPVCKIIND